MSLPTAAEATTDGAAPVSARGRSGRAAAALAAFALLAAAHTWPLATDPAHLSRNDNADALLNSWTLAWVAHQLPRHPLRLFDANIFYPERLTLAYSEAMFVQSALALPILAGGGSPVLAYNLVLLAGFALTGWAFCLLVRRWTGSWAAGAVAGSLAAFNAHSLMQLPHLQFLHVEFIALVLFALDRLAAGRRLRDAIALGAGAALQGLTSVYLLVFSTWMLAFAVPARLASAPRAGRLKAIALVAAAAVVSLALMAPYLAGYDALHRRTGLERAADEASSHAALWTDVLATGSRLHYAVWSRRFTDAAHVAAFPGLAGALLLALAFVWPETRRDARVRMCAWAAAGCSVVSMLPRAPFYPALHRHLLLFRVVRVPAYLGHVVLLLVAVLAGFGAAGLLRRLRAGRLRAAAAIVMLAAVNLEALRAPLEYTPFSGIPRIYDTLAAVPGAVVAELPLYPPRQLFANAEYMLNSTRHWRPLINGYSGFRPDWYDEAYDELQGFPEETALEALHRRGVTHVIVHADRFEARVREAIDRAESLVPLAQDGDIRIYRLR